MGIRCADHVTPLYPQKKLALTSPTGGGRSVGIVRSRTKATEFSFLFMKREISECSLKQVTTQLAESKDNGAVLSITVCRSPRTVETRVRYQGTPLGFVVDIQALGQVCFECYSLPCHSHSTDALYSLTFRHRASSI